MTLRNVDFAAYGLLLLYLIIALELVVAFVPLPSGFTGVVLGTVAFGVTAPLVLFARIVVLDILDRNGWLR